VIALTAVWSSNALSRTQPAAECDEGTELQTLTAPVESLVLTRVDHVPTEQDVSDLKSIDIEKVSRDTGTPLLDLAPRVNDALRGIFDDNGENLVDGTSLEISVAPIAESEDVPDLSELADDTAPDGASLEDSDLPLLERQMYRIDI